LSVDLLLCKSFWALLVDKPDFEQAILNNSLLFKSLFNTFNFNVCDIFFVFIDKISPYIFI